LKNISYAIPSSESAEKKLQGRKGKVKDEMGETRGSYRSGVKKQLNLVNEK